MALMLSLTYVLLPFSDFLNNHPYFIRNFHPINCLQSTLSCIRSITKPISQAQCRLTIETRIDIQMFCHVTKDF